MALLRCLATTVFQEPNALEGRRVREDIHIVFNEAFVDIDTVSRCVERDGHPTNQHRVGSVRVLELL